MAASSATSLDKPDEKKADRDAYLSQLVARYNYCVLRHPILTKSVTRYVKLEFRICTILYLISKLTCGRGLRTHAASLNAEHGVYRS